MSRFEGDSVFAGDVSFLQRASFFGGVDLPEDSVNDAAIVDNAEVDTNKLQHRHSKTVFQAGGTDVVSATSYIFVARAAGDIHSVSVRPFTAPTGGDKEYTVDVKRAADGSGAFSSVLTAPITVDSSSVSNTKQDGLIGSPDIAAGDLIQVVVTASGSTGSQGQGVAIEVQINESGA